MIEIKPGETITLNESDSALDAFCMSQGRSLVDIDGRIHALADDNPNRPTLIRLRGKLEKAHISRDLERMKDAYESLVIALKAACFLVPLAITGEKIIEGGNKGRERAYGNDEHKTAERALWQSWVDEVANERPDLSYEDIKRVVVTRHPGEVSASQLKRYTKNPRRK